MAKFVFKLYVAGKNRLSDLAVSNLHSICANELGGAYKIEVIDVLELPQLAEDEQILATPAVVKHLPAPLRKVVGDLSDTEQVLIGLDLQHVNMEAKETMDDGTVLA